jgi:hypothetical protein
MAKIGKETRSATVYVRVKPSNKAYLKKLAKQQKVSEAVVLDDLLEAAKRGSEKAMAK